MPVAAPAAYTAIAEAAASTVASAAVSYGVAKLTAPGKIALPPPPGAAMVDQATVAAQARQRRGQQVAGGLDSTFGAGTGAQGSFNAATSGAKSLLGQ